MENKIKDALGNFAARELGRRPMILPVVAALLPAPTFSPLATFDLIGGFPYNMLFWDRKPRCPLRQMCDKFARIVQEQ